MEQVKTKSDSDFLTLIFIIIVFGPILSIGMMIIYPFKAIIRLVSRLVSNKNHRNMYF